MSVFTTFRARSLTAATVILIALGLLLSLVVAPVQAAPEPKPLPTGVHVDYQLGGIRSVPSSVGIVVRDRKAKPLAGRYNICYVNAFQTQKSERKSWRHKRWHLVLKRNGKAVKDTEWNEWLLDIRTGAKRAKLAKVMRTWMKGCARAGYDAVELDNLDSFLRSRGLLSRKQAVAYAKRLVKSAHAVGLAVGQKNFAELNGKKIGFDFAIAEQCGQWRECAAYVRSYGRRVIAVEYRRKDFRWTCTRYGAMLPVVYRDHALKPKGVRTFC
ncbi:endo alpha-1,4 polygalactosaminidase [Mumia sp. ZJ1417]|uniref:endo alpha-1,4 polygalactosaminidase n=1 Tax=Mumia sp. ZJ1417 TaxID=2708082 RepID=UPI0015FDEF5B|nr:endo alpha-1,4 polygalactosaminidase [Mumia sp. ZJ1417]QMW66848.1 endo alpha-1,4 polygalactosaminidase [Mumia sp. ZJ1417]